MSDRIKRQSTVGKNTDSKMKVELPEKSGKIC